MAQVTAIKFGVSLNTNSTSHAIRRFRTAGSKGIIEQQWPSVAAKKAFITKAG
jgi:hypothetical protein